jgi:predicted DNA-binding helix-hairpin-helix protein
LPGGGTSILLKTLLSNVCVNDCKYCPLRQNTNIQRCTLSPDETARAFMDYLNRRNVQGLFLSSGVIGSPDQTMERINAVAEILRRVHRFKGYIHLKIIPGASDAAIREALSLASTVSLNIETPGETYFRKLSGRKRFLEDIIRPLKLLARLTAPGEPYRGVKTTTQFVVGAADETDAEIVRYMFGLYDRLHIHRVYFSAYQAGLGAPGIPGETAGAPAPDARFLREHRLYQADFLIRKYGFKAEDFKFGAQNNLSLEKDPKECWAESHPDFYPVKINRADRETLLRVPGFGPLTVSRILNWRRRGQLSTLQDLNMRRSLRQKALSYVRFD